jgi:hypothetical protein
MHRNIQLTSHACRTTRMRLLGPVLCVLSLSLMSCTDAATRVAYDLEAGAKRFRKAPTVAAPVEHSPKASPEGCPGGYTLATSANGMCSILMDER